MGAVHLIKARDEGLGSNLWLFFRSEEFNTPIMVLNGSEARTIADQILDAEKPAVNLVEEVPPFLLKLLRENPDTQALLDELVHDEKSAEASGLNNDGAESQIQYLRANGWDWKSILTKLGAETVWEAKEDGDGG